MERSLKRIQISWNTISNEISNEIQFGEKFKKVIVLTFDDPMLKISNHFIVSAQEVKSDVYEIIGNMKLIRIDRIDCVNDLIKYRLTFFMKLS